MRSIPMSLQSKLPDTSYTEEEEIPSPNQNSSQDQEQLESEVSERIQCNFSDQNQSPKIVNHHGFKINHSKKEILNKAKKPFNYSQKRKIKSIQTDQQKSDSSLRFLGKILLFTFIICALIGIVAAIIEKKLQNQRVIPEQNDGVEKSLTGFFNSRKNKFTVSAKDINQHQEVNVESLKKSEKNQGKTVIEKNFKTEVTEEQSNGIYSVKIQITSNTPLNLQKAQKNTNGNQKLAQNNVENKNNLNSATTQQQKQGQIIKQQSIKLNVQQNQKINSQKVITGSENKAGNQKIQNKKTEVKTIQNQPKPNNVPNTVQPVKSNAAAGSPLVYPAGNIIPQPQCSNYIQQQRKKYGGLYQFSVNRNIFQANSNVQYFMQRVPTKITKQKYREAVTLVEAIHNIDQNGVINSNDTPCQSGQSFKNRINQTIQKQTLRLNKQYQMDSYFNHQLRFCIVSNSYNNAHNGLIYRNVDSILQQNYTNYHVVYTDDASPDRTGELVKQHLNLKNIPDSKFKVKINPQKVGQMENIYNAITYDCQEGEIVVMLDGDDSFIGTNVLSLLNALYQKKKVALIWNNFLQINENSRGMMGFSRDLDGFANNFKSYRIAHRFVSSHLKSFFVDLFRKIKKQDLQENNGKFFGGASDTAMMMPMLQLSFPKFEYVPEIVYEYRFDTGQVGMTVNRMPQAVALTKLGLTEPYKSLIDFTFIDEAIKKVQK